MLHWPSVRINGLSPSPPGVYLDTMTRSHLLLAGLLVLSACTSCVGIVPYGCQGRMDIAFVMDQSESISENDPLDKPDFSWNLFKAFVVNVTRGIPVSAEETHVAMVKFSSRAEVMWYLSKYSYSLEVERAARTLQHNGGNTNTAEALQLTRQHVFNSTKGDRPDARNVIVLMTDGLSTIRQHDVKREAKLTRDAGIEIYVVSIGKYTDEDELRSIVTDFSKNIVHVQNFERLVAIQELLTYRVCGLPDPAPENKPPPNCEIMDLVLIVDNSGSIRDKNRANATDNYESLKDFLTNLVEQLDVAENRTRVATVRFSDIAELEFDLDDFTDKTSVKQKLKAMTYRGSHTNTSGALRLALRDVFQEKHGDRRDVRDVIILVTDGESTREKNRTILEANQVKGRGIEVYVIGVTDKINRDELKGIASEPDAEHFFDSTDIQYLNILLYNLLRNVCTIS